MDLRTESPTYGRTMNIFEEAAAHFVKTGFVVLSDPKVDTLADLAVRRRQYREQAAPIGNVFVRKIMRRVARDLKRPVVVAETNYWSHEDGATAVTLKKLKRNAPLIAQFLLLDEVKGHGNYALSREKGAVTWRQDRTNWYIGFNGAPGQKIFREWVAHCGVDPDCRKALKL